MFEKILVISELHYNFGHVLHCIRHLKKLGTQSCLLVQCLNPHELNDTVSTFIIGVYKEHLETQQQQLADLGLAVTTRQMIGIFRDNISQIALEEQCSLVIVGAPERTILGSLLDGGAAYHMMHGTSVPLLLVRTPANPDAEQVETPDCLLTDHVLFPTDFSENADKAFAMVKEAAGSGVKKITLLHVQDKARIDPHLLGQLDTFNEKDRERLSLLENELKSINNAVEVESRLLYGSPTSEILRVIQEEQVSWVIMGSQGRGWIREIYLGNVSHNIARHAAVPVLLVPAARGEE
ncbi:MAG: universal stress protein [Bacillota bacterium]|nr:universal stress protein [Bacillota bacterium]